MTLLALTPAVLQAKGRPCEALRAQPLPRGELTLAQSVAPGEIDIPAHLGEPARKMMLPGHCRVAGVLHPTPESAIRFELWMPARQWNGRFEAAGNGNYAGTLPLEALAHGVLRGSAIAVTDTGHSIHSPDLRTAEWGRNRDKLIDFGYRGVHEMVGVARSLVRSFYGAKPQHSYFVSCSNGGRQGLMSAQRYPDDFDGIVAGAPARSWTRLASAFIHYRQRFDRDADTLLSEDKVHVLESAVVAACDALDGKADRIIDDPRACQFDPGALQCRNGDGKDCLTAKQVETVRMLAAGVPGPASAHLAGLPTATAGEAWSGWIFGAASVPSGYAYLGLPLFRDFLYQDSAWTSSKFDLQRDSAAAQRELAPILDADDADLGRFFERGGKLILYSGWQDPAIPALDTLEYYEAVRQRLGAARSDRSVRLFMVPGMAHCGDGPGFSNFGQWYNGTGRPREDIRAAVMDWVEHGRAPQALVAARQGARLWTDPRVERPSATPVPTRLLCAYPMQARWSGKGSMEDASQFRCEGDEGVFK